MDRLTWMYKISRTSPEYISHVNDFIKFAEQNLKRTEHGKERMTCPCRDCYNLEKYSDVDTVRGHLFRRGFMDNYTKWIWHGEGIRSRKAESFSGNYESCGDGNPTNKEEEDDEENDRLDEMIQDVEEILMHQPKILENLVDDSKKLLYPGCNDQFTRLSTTLKLCKIKVKSGWSDKSFTELLKLVSDILPLNNELPTSAYEAKKILCPMGMNVKKIHACPYDCVLFRNEYEHLHTCPKCGASRYKRVGNNSSSGVKKSPPAKVLRYLPIMDRFKRLFANKNDAKLMRWHVEGRKSDGMLRHPADSPQWRTIDRKFPDFGGELRNLRLGLCADGMNPYRTLSSTHSTWPVLLTIYNLPPWLCMKRKYIMLTLLIPGPKEPGNNIDVYLQPLIEDLLLLWNQGERIYDAYNQTNFTLRAMIFCTISDFPGYGNLSGYTIKGAKACPICEDATIDLRLKNFKKNVYVGHRTFLHPNHPYRKRKRSFDGTIETRVARFLVKKRTSAKKDVLFKLEESGQQTIYVSPVDIDEFLTVSCLNMPIVEIFIRYLGTLCSELKEERFAFMLPSRLAIPNKGDYERSQEACDYITATLNANKERHFILAPYVQDNHWILLLFSLKESVIYIFDSLKRERNIRLKTPVQTAFKLYTSEGGFRNNRKEFLIIHNEVQCPQQHGGTECGFFVMKYMHDIIMHSQKKTDMNWKVVLASRRYTKKEMTDIRELWAKYFIRECL